MLDDGWFRGRRSEQAGLGDWYVDRDVWPDGLHPLVKHVRELGMEFGLWFEPEMRQPRLATSRATIPTGCSQPAAGDPRCRGFNRFSTSATPRSGSTYSNASTAC